MSGSKELSQNIIGMFCGSSLVLAHIFFIKMREVESRIKICYAMLWYGWPSGRFLFHDKDVFIVHEANGTLAMTELEKEKNIMKSSEEHMKNLKQWLQDTADSPLEEMSDFFTKRLHDYEEHMSIWEESYQIFAEILPLECQKILDLGCGTGLELDKIWQKNPNIEVTGVDLCANMLDKLLEKHRDKPLTTVCQDYFQYDFEDGKWDAVISFESLHHFLSERKKELYRKICYSLKKGGVFILGDYIACCDEEEELLRSVYLQKREQSAIPKNCYVHFDIPLTLEHETGILQNAGFVIEKILDDPDGATIIVARKGD